MINLCCFKSLNLWESVTLSLSVTKSCPTLATPCTVACQTPLSMGFSRREYWNGLPLPSPGDLPTQESNRGLLHCSRFFTDWAMREASHRKLMHNFCTHRRLYCDHIKLAVPSYVQDDVQAVFFFFFFLVLDWEIVNIKLEFFVFQFLRYFWHTVWISLRCVLWLLDICIYVYIAKWFS